MILSDIRNYVKSRGQVTLNDIAIHFDSESSAMEGMLQRWVDKGIIEKKRLTSSCGEGCQQCGVSDSLMFVWSTSDESKAEHPIYHLPFHCRG